MAEASVTAGTSREQHEPASPEVRQHILPSPQRSATLNLQVAQQPVERLRVGVVLLPACGAYEKSRRSSSITAKAAAMAESDQFVPKPAGPLSAPGIIQ
jgi:hypothetical protein